MMIIHYKALSLIQKMNKRILLYLLLIYILSPVVACKNPCKEYKIGVSICNKNDWRSQIEQEMVKEVPFYNNLDVNFSVANSNDSLQIAQIAQFIEDKVDLIIVIPREAYMLKTVIENAYDKGINIIVIDNKIPTEKYTAYIGADNFIIGKSIGQYISTLLPNGGKIIEITGNKSSEVAKLRRRGLTSEGGLAPHIDLVCTIDAKWSGELAAIYTDSLIKLDPNIKLIFAHNDAMAHSAYKSLERMSLEDKVKIIGVDGLPGENKGLDLLSKGILEMSVIYPTFGNIVLQRAYQILNNEPFEKETRLEGAIVNKTDAKVEILKVAKLEELNGRITELQQEARTYNNTTWGWILASVIVIGMVIIIVIQSKKRKMVVANYPSEPIVREGVAAQEQEFLNRFYNYINANLNNPKLGIEEMSSEMCCSRAQLHRKIKELTGESPIKLLRNARLARGQELLKSSILTISEVAYEVGFSSPSYFTKSYKEFYGKTPSSSV